VSWAVETLPDHYADSVRLMGVAAQLRRRDGVTACEIAMATPANLAALRELGVQVDAGPADVVMAVSGDEAAAALTEGRRLLTSAPAGEGEGERAAAPPRSQVAAARALDGRANVAVVSVPGEYAALEAHRAIGLGLHVFLFSDHVALEDEIALKRRAAQRGLLLMGPEAGTAMLGGVGLGFMNVVPRGGVGIVAAAGTGAQESACLVAAAGGGISQVIGVGGRDLSREVGGLMFRRAIELLAQDQATDTLLLVSKPADRAVVEGLAAVLPQDKRVVAAFVGLQDADLPFEAHATLDAAARAAAGSAPAPDTTALARRAEAAAPRGRVLGLYSGGTLAHEAQTILAPALGAIADEPDADGHAIVDLGAERYTRGRPHPMVDLDLRRALLEQAADDGRTGVVLLDVVLGHGAHPDPAAELAGAVERLTADALVIARVCGTADDPQDEHRQSGLLRDVGALVAPSNAAAVRLAARAVAAAEVAR